MKLVKIAQLLAAAVVAGALASCASKPAAAPKPGPDGKPVNPHPPGTYAWFKAEPAYPKTYNTWRDEQLLSRTGPENSSIVIDLKTQRGLLMNGDKVALDYPICSGRRSHPTPPGNYQVLEKVVDKYSNKYGKIYDAEGTLVNGDADITTDPIPEGGRFDGAPMRYWMRLTWDGIGHHIGPVRRIPVSHACVRGPSGVMPIIFSKVKVGTPITVR
jgi:hypothetical protein